MRFAGYAALFGERDAGRDLIRKGAFERTLAERELPIPLFWQHRPEMRIGWIERIAEDERGLRVIASIDNPQGGAAAALKRGTVNGLSFGYRARGYQRDAAGRELTEIDLYEVSLVSHPMQHKARVHMVEGDGERKFNQRHLVENGRFARAGEGVLYGGGNAATAGTARSGVPRASSAAKPKASEASERPKPDRNLENIRRTFGTVPAPKLNVSSLPRGPRLDLTSGDSAASFALRQVGAGTYRQIDQNPHAVGRLVPIFGGISSPRCNAMVYDSLNWAGAAPSRMVGGRIPVANEWGNPRAEIGYYPVAARFVVPRTGMNALIGSRLREGDVISDGVHVALVTLRFGFPQSVSAVTMLRSERGLGPGMPTLGGVVRNDWGFRPGQRIVVRRFNRTHRPN